MLLAEDLLILLVRESASEKPQYEGTQSALAVAVLVELAGRGRLEMGEDKQLRPVGGSPLGDPTLDTAMSLLGDRERSASKLARMITSGLHERLLDRLSEQGILTARARRPLSLPAKHVWRVTDTTRREELRAWLAAVLLGQQQPDPRSGALIALLHTLGALGEITADRTAKTRAKEIAKSDWPSDAVTKYLLDAEISMELVFLGLVATLPS